MSAAADTFVARDTSGAQGTEVELARALAKAGIVAAPIAVAGGWLIGGAGVAASIAFALALVVVNFLLSATSLAWAARISYALVMGVALFGFIIRMGLVAGAVLLVKDQSWVHPAPLGITLIVAHLGLLAWEARRVSATLAFPGLKPAPVKE